MVENKQNVIQAGAGAFMNLDAHPSLLTGNTYRFALNNSKRSGSGEEYLDTNEPSNVLCVRFPDGVHPTRFHYDHKDNKTYVFSYTDEGYSEIGVIIDTKFDDYGLGYSEECGCDFVHHPILDGGVDKQPYCTYTPILRDKCSPCIGFSKNNPVTSIVLKKEKCGDTLYWTTTQGAAHHLPLYKKETLMYTYADCEEPTLVCPDCEQDPDVQECVDCDKMRIFGDTGVICMEVRGVVYGGNLRRGSYQFMAAVCDREGRELSGYQAIVLPTSVFDENAVTGDETQWDDYTQKAINLSITAEKNSYFKLVVLYQGGVTINNGSFVYGVYSGNTTNVSITTLIDKPIISLNELLAVKPVYTRSKGLADANGYLFHAGVEAETDINLQPIVNLLGGFLEWGTVIAGEDLYKNGEGVSKYKGFTRKETYPVAIRFKESGGYVSPYFPLVGRPATVTDIETIDNDDTDSLTLNGGCSTGVRDKRWQLYDTSTLEGICDEGGGINTVDVPVRRTLTCEDDGVVQVTNTSTLFGYESGDDLLDYINTNRVEICDMGSEYYNQYLCGILMTDYPSTCTPSVSAMCGSPILVSADLYADTVANVDVVVNYKDINDYTGVSNNGACNVYAQDNDGLRISDTDFENTYITVGLVPPNVYKRAATLNMCTAGMPIPPITVGVQPLGAQGVLDYIGGDVLGDIQTTNISTCTGAGFAPATNKGGIWYNLDFNGEESIIVEIPTVPLCTDNDNIPSGNTEVRVSVFDGCGGVGVDCSIVDLTVGGRLQIFRVDYSADNVKIYVDAPYKVEVGPFADSSTGPKYRTTPPCGCLTVLSRVPEIINSEVTYTDLRFSQVARYSTDCIESVPAISDCEPVTFEHGTFSYHQSLVTYPDNRHLWDSSGINIAEDDLPVGYGSKFESMYTDGVDSGVYLLKDDTDLRCKPIRHFTFPSNLTTAFIRGGMFASGTTVPIVPIGLKLDDDIVNAFLNVAVKNGLITAERRNRIVGWELAYGDRTANKSVLARGLAYDMYKYEEDGKDNYFSNFPYNDLGSNNLIFEDSGRDTLLPHPYGGTRNNRFTFHSPDTHFTKISLPPEVQVEGYQLGASEGFFPSVDKHSEWVILNNRGYVLATTLAVAEVALETAIKLGEFTIQSAQTMWVIAGVSTGTGAAGTAVSTVSIIATTLSYLVNGFVKVGQYRYEWLNIFRNNGRPYNYVDYYVSTGSYNYLLQDVNEGDTLRGVPKRLYLKPGRSSYRDIATGGAVYVNHVDRESTVLLDLGTQSFLNYPLNYREFDNGNTTPGANSRFFKSEAGVCTIGEGASSVVERNIGSPYVTLYNYNPSQYGSIDSVRWKPLVTSCGDTTGCKMYFGGDTFISRFSLKRKFPLFLVNGINLAPRTPFDYYRYRNVGYPRFFCDYDTQDNPNILGQIWPQVRSEYNFDCKGNDGLYVSDKSRMYLYYYGIPSFLVESEVNCNFRYARREAHEGFYPEVSDIESWTQEDAVSIKRDNTFYYDFTHSNKGVSPSSYMLQPDYDPERDKCLFSYDNSVIWSKQDNSEQETGDPWLSYKALDIYNFPARHGDLVDIRGIESSQILVRFKEGFVVFNAVDTLRDRLGVSNLELGSGGIFATRPMEFVVSDLGFGGTQNKAMVSTPYGRFWVDAKRGKIVWLAGNAKGVDFCGKASEGWLQEHLPFQLLCVDGVTEDDIDNITCTAGISMGYDARNKRVFVTKKDYRLLIPGVRYVDGVFKDIAGNEVSLKDPTVFEDVSFTLGIDVMGKELISFYSFIPDFYLDRHNHFITVNDVGTWAHLVTNKSYQTFYGVRYPWILELPLGQEGVMKKLGSVRYWMDSRFYVGGNDLVERRGLGFNKSVIYNHSNNSGIMNLVTLPQNNSLWGQASYPKIVSSTEMDIIATESDMTWAINSFYNRVKDEGKGPNPWINNHLGLPDKLNPDAFLGDRRLEERLKGDWYLLRLIQDKRFDIDYSFKFGVSGVLNYRK